MTKDNYTKYRDLESLFFLAREMLTADFQARQVPTT